MLLSPFMNVFRGCGGIFLLADPVFDGSSKALETMGSPGLLWVVHRLVVVAFSLLELVRLPRVLTGYL